MRELKWALVALQPLASKRTGQNGREPLDSAAQVLVATQQCITRLATLCGANTAATTVKKTTSRQSAATLQLQAARCTLQWQRAAP